MIATRPHILSRDPLQLEQDFSLRGWDRYRVEQVLGWVYRGMLDPLRIPNLPRHLREGPGAERQHRDGEGSHNEADASSSHRASE